MNSASLRENCVNIHPLIYGLAKSFMFQPNQLQPLHEIISLWCKFIVLVYWKESSLVKCSAKPNSSDARISGVKPPLASICILFQLCWIFI